MKQKSLIILFLLLPGSTIFAQASLEAFLESNPICRMGINLVFKNQTDQYILLPTTFDNLTWEGKEAERLSTIKMVFYNNGQPFTLTGKPRHIPSFSFYWGSVQVAPHSEVRLPFHIGKYHFPFLTVCEVERLEVSFFITYLYFIEREGGRLRGWVSAVTNRVRIVTPADEIIEDEREPANVEEYCYWGVCLICRGAKLMMIF